MTPHQHGKKFHHLHIDNMSFLTLIQVVKSCPDAGLGYYPEGQGPDKKGKMVLG